MTPPTAGLVFLVGEGPNDIGDLSQHESYRTGREGFMQPVVRAMLGPSTKFDGKKISLLPKDRLGSAKGAEQRRAAQALLLASLSEADWLVFISDLDRTPGTAASRTERRRRLRERREAIEKGFAEARASSPDLAGISAIAAVPCRMIEAWALGDHDAVKDVAGGTLGAQWRDPEALWGAEGNPASGHPKCVLDRALGRRHTTVDLVEIAKACDPATLETTCPDSFGPFAKALRGIST